eukprot:365122-Chlamydomonas_euryale.AAC.28
MCRRRDDANATRRTPSTALLSDRAGRIASRRGGWERGYTGWTLGSAPVLAGYLGPWGSHGTFTHANCSLWPCMTTCMPQWGVHGVPKARQWATATNTWQLHPPPLPPVPSSPLSRLLSCNVLQCVAMCGGWQRKMFHDDTTVDWDRSGQHTRSVPPPILLRTCLAGANTCAAAYESRRRCLKTTSARARTTRRSCPTSASLPAKLCSTSAQV